jgi:hypothetical protein
MFLIKLPARGRRRCNPRRQNSTGVHSCFPSIIRLFVFRYSAFFVAGRERPCEAATVLPYLPTGTLPLLERLPYDLTPLSS